MADRLNKIYLIIGNLVDYSIIRLAKIALKGWEFAKWLGTGIMEDELTSYKKIIRYKIKCAAIDRS